MSYEQSAKRRKTGDDAYVAPRPSSRFVPVEGGRSWTVSVAIPGSVLSDCLSPERRTAVAGRLARALAVFSVDEVVIYDDSPPDSRPKSVDRKAHTGDVDPCHFLEHVLGYLEVPPFMRKLLYPLHPNLRTVSQLPSMDMPHHPNPADWLPYREGVAGKTTPTGTVIDVGLKDTVTVEDEIPPNTRVTLHYPDYRSPLAEACDPAAPREDGGLYWGYTVRRADSLSALWTECKYEGGYDVSIGTSERGRSLGQQFPDFQPLQFKHLLVVFGGPRGIEYAAVNDKELEGMDINAGKVRELFDHWVNVLPGQGSRAIRTDEALWVGMTAMRRLWAEDY
ncbi:putative methyltransferase C9orf114 [Colletotrichum sidae]|uniref:Methyltransferase C9orf114 n=4 Tax=Colletotrichum orbiculare species complex TaxID=2707354 RepID=A0A484FT07_COLOR|nr:putative methyltransferase C9orf114 [Colletotrichum orbiculare MAFF 240422]TDZ32675.1 putative methyltransferase C9orf114 [Colletotrichum spinosum]TDZ74909.1 putative methyltransferase C9orf114 [Colletotrichum trifolii]TEA13506.1 putative methyltransferase C9orf114 [Colletotrichum sidae]